MVTYYQNNGFNMIQHDSTLLKHVSLAPNVWWEQICYTPHVFSRADLLTGLIKSCQAFHWPSINDTYPLVIKHGMLENFGKRSVYKSNIIQLKASEI